MQILIHHVLAGNDEPTAPKTISADVGKAMQKARQDLNMKQSDLATKVNEKVRFSCLTFPSSLVLHSS